MWNEMIYIVFLDPDPEQNNATEHNFFVLNSFVSKHIYFGN